MKQKILLFFMLFVSALCKAQQEDVSMVSFIQEWSDDKSTLALKNNTDEEITSVRFNIEYYSMSDVMEDYEEFNEEVTIAPRMTKKINIKAYESGRHFAYEKSKSLSDANRFKVRYKYIGCTKANTESLDGKTIMELLPYENENEGNRNKNNSKFNDRVEKMASFPGGFAALMQYLSTNMMYPKIAEENGIQGRVITTFIVGIDGGISDINVTKPVDPSLDKEAIRLIKSMPKWIPGEDKDGNPVNVKYTLPLTFRLQ